MQELARTSPITDATNLSPMFGQLHDQSLVITLPIHNEASRLEHNVAVLHRFLEEEKLPSVIVLAEDGSTDKSSTICRQLSRSYPNVLFIHHEDRLGRGKAMRGVWKGLKGHRFKFCMFMDADLATDLSSLKPMLKALEQGNDLVLGSRYARSAIVARPKLRFIVSVAYNKIVRTLFRVPITDLQCGFKGFGPRALDWLLPATREHSCFWDTEVCVVGSWMRLKTVEIPVNWREPRSTRTPIGRLISDIIDHGTGLIRLLSRYGEFREYAAQFSRSKGSA